MVGDFLSPQLPSRHLFYGPNTKALMLDIFSILILLKKFFSNRTVLGQYFTDVNFIEICVLGKLKTFKITCQCHLFLIFNIDVVKRSQWYPCNNLNVGLPWNSLYQIKQSDTLNHCLPKNLRTLANDRQFLCHSITHMTWSPSANGVLASH